MAKRPVWGETEPLFEETQPVDQTPTWEDTESFSGTDLAKKGVGAIRYLAGMFAPEQKVESLAPGISTLKSPTAQRYGGDVLSGAVGSVSGGLAAIPALESSFNFESPVGRAATSAYEKLDALAKEVEPKKQDFTDDLFKGAGSMAAFMLPAAGSAATLSKIPAMAATAVKIAPAIGASVATVLEAATEAGDTFKNVLSKTKDREKAAAAAQKDFFPNLILIGITNKFGVYGDSLTGLKKAIASAPLEGIQEFGQQLIQDVASGQPINWDAAVKSLGVGAIIGFGAGGVNSFSDGQSETAGNVEGQPTFEQTEPIDAPQVISSKRESTPQEISQIYGGGGKSFSGAIQEKLNAGTEGLSGAELAAKINENAKNAERELIASMNPAEGTPAPAQKITDTGQPQDVPISEAKLNEPISLKSDVEYKSPDEVPVTQEEGIVANKPDGRAAAKLQAENDASFQKELKGVEDATREERIRTEESFSNFDSDITAIQDARVNRAISTAEYNKLLSDKKREISNFSKDVLSSDKDAEIQRALNLATTPSGIKSVIRKLDEAINPATSVKGVPIKKAIERNTGINPVENSITAKESDLLTQRIRAEVTASKQGYREGVRVEKELLMKQFLAGQQRINEAVDYINEKLPPEYRGKFINAIKNASTPTRKAKLINLVDLVSQEIEKKAALSESESLSRPNAQVSLDYQNKISDLVADIDFRKMTDTTRRKLISLGEFLNRTKGENNVPIEIAEKIDRLSKTPARDLSLDEARDLRDTIKELTAIGKLKQSSKMKYNERERKVAETKLLNSTTKIEPSGDNRLLHQINNYYNATLHAPRVADRLDGYKKYNGENAKLVKRAMTLENEFNDAKATRVSDLMGKIAQVKKDWSDQDMLAIMFHLYNEQPGGHVQAQALIDAYGLTEIPSKTPQIQEAMDIARKAMDEKYIDIAATLAELENRNLDKVENYFPLKYEREENLAPDFVAERESFKTTKTNKGFTFGRKQNVKKIPRVDFFNIMEEAISEQEWYLKMQPYLDNTKRLVLTDAYKQKAGVAGAGWWRKYLDIIARHGWASNAKANFALKEGRINLTNAVMGYKLTSALMQPMAIFDAIAFTEMNYGPKMAAKVAQEFTKSWVNPRYAKEYIEGSSALRNRRGGELSLEEALDADKQKSGFKAKFLNSAMSLLKEGDLRTAAGVQRGIEKVLKDGGVKNAREEAEFLMNLASGSSDVTARPTILSEGEFMRMMFTFQSFAMNQWGIVIHDIVNSGMRGNWKSKLNTVIALGVMAAGVEAAKESRKWVQEKVTGKKLKDESFTKSALLAIPELVPFFGNIISAAVHPEYSSVPPLWKTAEDLAKGTNSMISSNRQKTRRRGMLKAAEAGLSLYPGIPGTAQAFDLLEGYINR